MKHVETIKERVTQIGAGVEYDFIAIFQCSKVLSHRKREAFDPSGAF